jgi:putative endonuclease
MMTDPSNTCLYIGVTSNLFKRVNEHRTHAVDGYTKTHDCIKLVYYEEFLDTYMAIQREKTLKGKLRRKKNAIIEEMNPDWKDLFLLYMKIAFLQIRLSARLGVAPSMERRLEESHRG